MRVGQRGNVRQDQRLELVQVCGVEQTVVDHLEGDARLDERLIPAERVVFDFCAGAVAAVKPRGLLRIHQPCARERRLIAQILFPTRQPLINPFHRLEPAFVVQHAAEFREPRTQAIRDAIGHPEANLRFALHAVLPAIRFFEADAEDADDRFAAHGGAKFLPVFAIRPRRSQAAAGLAVGDEGGRPFADFLHVERTGRAAAGVRDDAGVRIYFSDFAVPKPPEIEEPLLAPEEVGATGRVLRVVRERQLETARLFEMLAAMLAITHAGTVPTIDENGVHLVARHDFALHLGHKLEVVRAEAARDPQLRRRPVPARLAARVHRDPSRMRVMDVVVSRMRVRAGEDDHAELATTGDQIAERILVAEPLTAMVERHLGRVIRDAAAGAQTNRVRACALEIVEPELRIELAGVILDECELRPTHRSVCPGRSCVRLE